MPYSYSGTKKVYITLQMRPLKNSQQWHIQGKGYETNREYGVAVDLNLHNLHAIMRWWLRTRERDYPSAVGESGAKYIRVHARVKSTHVSFQVCTPNKLLNRNYGASFKIKSGQVPPDLILFIQQHQDDLEKST